MVENKKSVKQNQNKQINKTNKKSTKKSEKRVIKKSSKNNAIDPNNFDYLIIAEKPKAALQIAKALSDNKQEKISINKIPVYSFTKDNQKIAVASAVGHIFGLSESKKTVDYPVFDIQWKPSYEIKKTNDYTKKYIDVLKKLKSNNSKVIVATDYDIEGELIGWNVIRFVFNLDNAERMKFSTLTPSELKESFNNRNRSIDWGLAKAGETRHILDWYYGINISRALSAAIKSAGRFKILSSGRVQGPALKIIVDKEKEIQAFKPETYYEIEVIGIKDKKLISAFHINGRFNNKDEAESIFNKIKSKDLKVIDIKKTIKKIPPVFPFDLTTLQSEAYNVLGIKPKETLSLAQDLYISGMISYPRTSSQKLPSRIGYKKIFERLKSRYEKQVNILKDKKLKPFEGKQDDPAHPAIYPTGLFSNVSERHLKLYDLIVKRFFACFGDFAEKEIVDIKFDINNETFIAKGSTIIKKGWIELYEPYFKSKDILLPSLSLNEVIKQKDAKLHEKQTQPPKRYTQASIIKELAKRNLGTKATRAQIIDTLYQRNYITGDRSIQATELGIKTIESLEKICPEIIDEQLTRHFEDEMELIQQNKKDPEEVKQEAKDVLTKILNEFKTKEKDYGKELLNANTQADYLGKCPLCKTGNLRIIVSKKTKKRFVACTNYPECKLTLPLPQKGKIIPTNKTCKECGYPIIIVKTKGKKPWNLCLNPKCPSKAEYYKNKENKEEKKIN